LSNLTNGIGDEVIGFDLIIIIDGSLICESNIVDFSGGKKTLTSKT